MPKPPEVLAGSRLCLVFGDDHGLTAYCNRKALHSLAKQLEWIAQSNPNEYNHCHILMSLADDQTRFEPAALKNVWTLVEEGSAFKPAVDKMLEIDPSWPPGTTPAGFELTFMMVQDEDLDDMVEHQKTGVLPISKDPTDIS